MIEPDEEQQALQKLGINPIHAIRIEALHAAVSLHEHTDKIDQFEICLLAAEFASWIADGTLPDEPDKHISLEH